jgi:uncharacterized protein YfbU (UPF0304 family)
MNYIEDFHRLKKLFALNEPVCPIDNLELHKLNFHSKAHTILPGSHQYQCLLHHKTMLQNKTYHHDVGTIKDDVHIKDIEVIENTDFSYHILKHKDTKTIKKAIFLFHGFNEKHWDKYLPWAKYLCENTGRAVILFPIAFHMQRAPQYWSNKRDMYSLCEKRKKRYPNVINSTLSNVAISMRLHASPQRFVWSGLQTYYDVIQLLEQCKRNDHPLIDKDFTYDILAYSIGGLLAEVLKMSNHKDFFSHSKICLFCGGAVFNRLSPVSKYILDSDANLSLYSFCVEHFDSHLKSDSVLNHYINEEHMEGKVFHAMLDYNKKREFRESLLHQYHKDFYAIALRKDTVIPPFEVGNTLQGAYRDIDIKVEELDFDFNYSHETPFPQVKTNADAIDLGFRLVFDKFCAFLLQGEG